MNQRFHTKITKPKNKSTKNVISVRLQNARIMNASYDAAEAMPEVNRGKNIGNNPMHKLAIVVGELEDYCNFDPSPTCANYAKFYSTPINSYGL